jgi:type III secretion protein U
MSQSSGEKDQEPTPKRLKEARDKGQVAKSQDVNSTVLLVGTLLYSAIIWPFALQWLGGLALLSIKLSSEPFEAALPIMMAASQNVFFYLVMPLMALVVVLGIASNFFQVGAIMSLEPVKPSLKKLNPMEGIKKIFSMKSLVEFLKSVAKILIVGTVVVMAVWGLIGSLIEIPFAGINGIFEVLPGILLPVTINTVIAYAVIAAFDMFYQQKQHIKGLRMTKDEVKREYKEMEGDPMIKSKRKQLHREMAMNDQAQNTRKASVLVTNPTHYAIALYYEPGKTKLPVVVAKGEGTFALRMMEIAKEADVPIMRNVDLAQALYNHAHVDQYIPADLIEPVAEVLRWVRELKEDQQF